jgi:hypothetical protein
VGMTGDPGPPGLVGMTDDLRPRRLNLVVLQGAVVRAAFF